MAARNMIARLIRAEGVTSLVGGGGMSLLPRRCARPSSAGIRAHGRFATMERAAASSASSASSIAPSTMMTTMATNDPRVGSSNVFSTAARLRPGREGSSSSSSSSSPPMQKANNKRSPHSKLLRVCSERNANSHFAAIEADLLRLQWKESMDALVEDWTSQDRFDDLMELERNVRSYVIKNLADLKRVERACVREWKRGGGAGERGSKGGEEGSNGSSALSLSDLIRFHYFPYEDIVTGIMRRAVAGEYVLSPYEFKLVGGNEDKRSMVEIHGRIAMLSKAGELLDAMTSFDADDESPEADGSDRGGWTVHHTACSNCHRSVLSGWFLLYRRLREANGKLLAGSDDAADVLDATTKLDAHPENEARVWAERWIEFCTGGRREGVGETISRGILPSDKPLLIGVVKILSMSENPKRREQSARLNQRVKELFRDG